VSASNFYGESVLSTAGNNAYYTTEPDAPINLAEDVSKRTSTKVGLTWEDASNTGGMPIIDYRIKQRVAGGTYSFIAIGLSQKAFTPSGLQLGTTYEWTVQSRNSVGYSAESDSLLLLHALPPEQPAAPSVQNEEQSVVVTWIKPEENGSTITAFKILFK